MSYEQTMDWVSATADHAGEVARPPFLETAPGSASSDRDRAKQLGKALVAILRYKFIGQWLTSAELVEELHHWRSEQEVVAVLRQDTRRFRGRPRAPPDDHGWTDWEYRAIPKWNSRSEPY